MKARGIGLNIAPFLGFFDRGFIRPSMWANLVIFNPKRVTNKTTYRDPKQYSKGILNVLVNGEVVVSQDDCTGALPRNPEKVLTQTLNDFLFLVEF